MRRLLTPAFHLHILKFYAPVRLYPASYLPGALPDAHVTQVVVETTQVLIDKFLALAKANPEQDHDVFDDFQLMTLDVICRAAFRCGRAANPSVSVSVSCVCVYHLLCVSHVCSYEGDPQRNPEDKYSQSIAKVLLSISISTSLLFLTADTCVDCGVHHGTCAAHPTHV